MRSKEPLEDVALAISAFRSDEQVVRLLGKTFEPGQPRFAAVIVVDSLGSGHIEETAKREGWPLRYINADRNLGSAGNLDLRLRTAADLGLEWCFALNHDGALDQEKVGRLIEHGQSRPRIGAVYPQLIFTAAGHRPDSPRRRFHTYGLLEREARGDGKECVEVVWSSSNGALYRLDPVREGMSGWPQLWMGYEDLAIGWELKRRGWGQLLCRDVEVEDNYEFSPVRPLGRTIHLAAKPPWYNYYQERNLMLLARAKPGAPISWAGALARFVIDLGLIIAIRDSKIERLRLSLRGFVDGLRGRTGKGPVP